MQFAINKNIGSEKLLICVQGWASDDNTSKSLFFDGFDVVTLFDYRTKELPNVFNEFVEKHKEIYIVAWSFGVFVAEQLFVKLPIIKKAIAINGTSYPVHAKWGIPPKAFAITKKSIAFYGMQKFYENMLGNQNVDFQECKRSVEELSSELNALGEWFDEGKHNISLWSNVIIGRNDRIFPYKNMFEFWEKEVKFIDLESFSMPHYPYFGEVLERVETLVTKK
ncbi:MAG: DUF452 family protein [Bacteroidetes bacterium]|nr:DUF452 family protein [Bacteroidota bacterium]